MPDYSSSDGGLGGGPGVGGLSGLIGFAEDDYRRMQRQQLLTQLPPGYSSLHGLTNANIVLTTSNIGLTYASIVKDISFKGKLEQEIKDWCGGILGR